ncbi:MAG: Flp family type IVb pilin [Nitrospirales bacterium]|nr:Flp family type IVb pilin [Nitrospirales bacterium]
MRERFGASRCGEEGAAAVEYALITGLVAVVITPAVSELGLRMRDVFQRLADAMA